MEKFILALVITLLLFTLNAQITKSSKKLILPVGGNSWSTSQGKIQDQGFIFKSIPSSFVSYIYLNNSKTQFAKIKTLIKIKMKTNQSVTVKLTSGKQSTQKTVKGSALFKQTTLSYFNLKNGYNSLMVTISSPKIPAFVKGQVQSIIFEEISSSIVSTYVDKKDFFYFGRRGPSGYLRYQIKDQKQISYFYNEVFVPVGSDKIGSYFVANGFDQGYFGIQVISATERRILFSVWSEYDPQNPIPNVNPNDYKVIPLIIGPGVTNGGQFKGEGAGGQTYLIFNWTSCTTYKFLTKASPQADDSTVYTSWFYDPAAAKDKTKTNAGWRLIASIKRPRIKTYLRGLFSFIQCFQTEYGNVTRMAYYKNQYIYGSSKKWISVNDAKFTYDSTAQQNQRIDVQGGRLRDRTGFYLKNTGFFNPKSKSGDIFKRKDNKIIINVDLTRLP